MSVPSKPIQAAAPGFLALLGVKNLGANPDTLQGDIAPQIDMEGWYLRGQHQILSTLATCLAAAPQSFAFYPLDGATGLRGTVDLTVPTSAWRYVHRFSIFSATFSANDLLYAVLAHRRSLGGVSYDYFPIGETFGAYAFHSGAGIAGSIGDFWVPPGHQIGWFVNFNLAADENVAFSLDFTDVMV